MNFQEAEARFRRIESQRAAGRIDEQAYRDDWGWENQTFAIIRQPNGRARKMHAMPDWRVGDPLEKRRGEGQIRKL